MVTNQVYEHKLSLHMKQVIEQYFGAPKRFYNSNYFFFLDSKLIVCFIALGFEVHRGQCLSIRQKTVCLATHLGLRPQYSIIKSIPWLLLSWLVALTHWGRVTHICVSKLTIIGSDNGLSPGRPQAIIWTNAGILLIQTSETNFSEI